MKTVLHVGCGENKDTGVLNPFFKDYREIRLDINKDVNPDIVADVCDLSSIKSESHDAIYTYHNLEHVHNYKIPGVLQSFNRILKNQGILYIGVPNIYMSIYDLMCGTLEEEIFSTDRGPVNTLSLLYGFDPAIKNNEYQLHKTAFTEKRFRKILPSYGFEIDNIWVDNAGFDLCVICRKAKSVADV